METTSGQPVCPLCRLHENVEPDTATYSVEMKGLHLAQQRLRCRSCNHVFAEPHAHAPVDTQAQVSRVLARIDGDLRLNLGCGRSPIPGWINIDSVPLPEVDVVVDLEAGSLPFASDGMIEFSGSHVLEHIRNSLGLMQELHRIAKPNATAVFRVPYASSDDADADPTHVRRYVWGSWGYFSQPYYWRADYGYRGDWEVEEILLIVTNEFNGKPWTEVYQAVQTRRNVVVEMVATLRAIKPIRSPDRSLQKQPVLRFITNAST
jgi:SAM-dependent methyltransferase